MMLALIPLRYRLLAVVAMAAMLFGTGYYKGHSNAASACREKELRAEIAAMKYDVAVQNAADENEAKLNSQIAANAAARETELQAYVDELRSQKDCRRSLDGADIERLRKIDQAGHGR